MASDVEQPIYRERLWPSLGVWSAGFAFGAALGLIPGPIDTTVAWITGIVGSLAMIIALALLTPSLVVTDDSFAAGRAQVPLALLSGAEVLTADEMKLARGTGLDARAYLLLRGWMSVGVRVYLNDPEDPTPYWLVSSRHPEALAAAVSSRIRQSPQTN